MTTKGKIQFGEHLTPHQERARSALTSGPGIAWVTVFLLLPLLFIVAISFASRGTYGDVQWRFTLENFKRFLGFGVFILACGATHFMEVWTLWTPVYWLSGAVKVVTAAASVVVAIVLPPLLPKSLALIRSAKLSEQRKLELEAANDLLRQEITQRKTAEEEVRRLNANLEETVRVRTMELAQISPKAALAEAILKDSKYAVWTVDLGLSITSWNSAAERLFGYPAEEVLGRPASMLAPPERKAEAPEGMARMKQDKDLDSYETVRVRKDGALLYLYLMFSPIRNQLGGLQGASVLASDITEHRRAQEMFHLAVEAAPNAMIMTDAEGKMVLVNAQTEKLFGYTREELIGLEVEMLVPHQYRDEHAGYRRNFMHEQCARAMTDRPDLYGVRKDGSEFPVEIGLNPVKTDRGPLVFSAIVDITSRKQADTEIKRLNQDLERRVLERTVELTAANAELESFSYSVAHDLRAPLRQIAGFSKILMEEHGAEISGDTGRYLKRIQDGAHHMGNLVDDLLLLAKVSRQTLSRRSTPLDDLISSVLETLQPDCAGREIRWEIDPLWTAHCDSALVAQAFVNLLSNAIKFTRFRAQAVIQIGQTRMNGQRVIFVRDNGAGFDMAHAGKLFGVFQRLHKAAEFEGTGIGLANVQRIVHKHGGRIWAEAAPDQGATFFLTLPDAPLPDAPSVDSMK
jgi:PAS domain S-box-containing protein